ncbi:MAG: hypothetical protein K2Y40_14050 [Reyranella sp.]|nr:hypothetical protein [Reyranella sp.]
MDDAKDGFRLGDDGFFPWGTRFDAVVRDIGHTGYASREIACASAYGFATRYVELTAPRPDRPVMNVAYELAGTDRPPKDVFAQLVIRLGAPTSIERDDAGPLACSPDHVVLYATWDTRHGTRIGLSLYGAARASAFGDGVGKLYVSWTDIDAAAAPWLAEWRAANARLVEDAEAPATMTSFSVRYGVSKIDRHDPWRAANTALSHPELLDTPAPLARRLGAGDFALWSDAAGARWHLSTGDLTVVLGGPETTDIRVGNIAPARGGGSASIDVGGWSVRCAHDSRSIEGAAQALGRIPGVTVSRYSGSDA